MTLPHHYAVWFSYWIRQWHQPCQSVLFTPIICVDCSDWRDHKPWCQKKCSIHIIAVKVQIYTLIFLLFGTCIFRKGSKETKCKFIIVKSNAKKSSFETKH